MPFEVTVEDLINPPSLKPSSTFTDIRIISAFNFEIATFEDPTLLIQTQWLAEVEEFKLTQSEIGAGKESLYTIELKPGSRLPHTTAFKITAPKEIEIARASYDDCYVETQRVVKGRCSYEGTDILKIDRGLAYFRGGYYYGDVKIVFKAINPRSNLNQNVNLKLDISLDNSYKWTIASIDGGLAPSFECNYPCLSCSANDPDDCESC